MCRDAGSGADFDNCAFIGCKYNARLNCDIIAKQYFPCTEKANIVSNSDVLANLQPSLLEGRTKDATTGFHNRDTVHRDRPDYSIPFHMGGCLLV
jgi:hypothetical protein